MDITETKQPVPRYPIVNVEQAQAALKTAAFFAQRHARTFKTLNTKRLRNARSISYFAVGTSALEFYTAARHAAHFALLGSEAK